MKILTRCLCILGLCVAATLAVLVPAARATLVVPPSFDDLVSQADTVFTGDVTGVRSEYTGEGANRHIVTYATFDVLRVMKGEAPTPYTLRMLGGTVGNRTLEVDGAPKFTAGERAILFVKDNGKLFYPTVGVMYGVYRLARPEGSAQAAERVFDHAHRAIASTEEIGQSPAARQARRLAVEKSARASRDESDTALSREQFEDAIVERVRTLGAK